MPPKGGPLDAAQKDAPTRWIQTGAKWPAGYALHARTERELALRKKAHFKKIVELEAYPVVRLQTKEDFNSIVVRAKYPTTSPGTPLGKPPSPSPKPGSPSGGTGPVPVKDGKTELRISYRNPCRRPFP